MTEEEKKVPWLDTPDPQRFINNAAKFSDLMMMYRCAIREVQTLSLIHIWINSGPPVSHSARTG